MKALVLVGGYGTRLRPLTLSVPKPLVTFCNKSILEHQIQALVEVGVTNVILAVAYQPLAMSSALKEFESQFGITIQCSREEEPLGTAGPIRLARDLLMTPDNSNVTTMEGIENEDFFVCNSDVICDFPLGEMLDFHRRKNAEGTILVTKVDCPEKYGVVVANEEDRILRFAEKPKEFVGDMINAGIYVFKKKVINRIPLRPTSIEKETFPSMCEDRSLFRFVLKSFWADIGQPKDFLHGTSLYLARLEEKEKGNGPKLLAPEAQKSIIIRGNVLIDPTASIGEDCVLGPNVTIGAQVVIGRGVRIAESAVMAGARIKDYSCIHWSIIGWHCTIGRWARLEGLTVLGEDVHIREECFVNGAIILPNKLISESIQNPGTIVM